jgi:RHS repeat-associated protein
MKQKSPWHNLEFIFIALTVVSVLVVFSFYFDAGVFGKFSIGEELTSEPQPLIQSSTESEISYVYANGQRIASLSNDGIKYYHSDYLGSSRLITDQEGVKAADSNYYPFGSILREEGSVTKYAFTGKELDSTGLQYFGARYYDSQTGRFTQIDPLGVGYAYANNNPMKFVDPSGMQYKDPFEQAMKNRPSWDEVKAAWASVPRPWINVGGLDLYEQQNNFGEFFSALLIAYDTHMAWADPIGIGVLAGGVRAPRIVGGARLTFLRADKTVKVFDAIDSPQASRNLARELISRAGPDEYSGSAARTYMSFLYDENRGLFLGPKNYHHADLAVEWSKLLGLEKPKHLGPGCIGGALIGDIIEGKPVLSHALVVRSSSWNTELLGIKSSESALVAGKRSVLNLIEGMEAHGVGLQAKNFRLTGV